MQLCRKFSEKLNWIQQVHSQPQAYIEAHKVMQYVN